MKTPAFKIAFFAAALLAGICQAAAFDGIVIANDSVPAASLTASALKDILTGKTMYWEGGQAVIIVFLGDKAEAALKEASGMDSNAFKTFWQRLVFSGRGQQPKKADEVDKAVALVAQTKGAIALVPMGASLKGVKKIELK
jgi:ABC-type phosphate transport system substrate-binding protein